MLASLAFIALIPGQTLTLQEAIAVALKNNSTFVVIEQDATSAQAIVEREEGVFAPRLFLESAASYAQVPSTATVRPFDDTKVAAELGVRGRLATGLTYRLGWANLLYEKNTEGIYRPFHSSAATLALVQPLLRGGWSTVNLARINIAAIKSDESVLFRRAQAERLIAEVEVRYWTLVLARKALEVRRGAVKIAEQQLEATEKKLKAGSISPADLLESELQLRRSREQIPTTEQQMVEAEGRLFDVLQPPAEKVGALPPEYTLTSAPSLLPLTSSLEEYLLSADTNRPDLAAARADIDAALVAEEVAENALWPALDLVASAGVAGASGHFLVAPRSPSYPDPDFEGGLINTYKTFRYPSGSIGLRFELPLDNSEARGQHRFQIAQTLRQRALADALASQVRIEVVTAYKRVKTDQDRMNAIAETVKISEALLDAQNKRFKEGVATSFDISRASRGLTRARVALIRAQVQAQISQARLALSEGRYLEARGVNLFSRPGH